MTKEKEEKIIALLELFCDLIECKITQYNCSGMDVAQNHTEARELIEELKAEK